MIEIAAFAYKYIYYFLVTILTIMIFVRYYKKGDEYENKDMTWGTIILVMLMILFIGFRPESGLHFVDMTNYITHYNYLFEGVAFHFNTRVDNFIFDNLFAWWGSNYLGYTSFFVLIAAIYFGVTYLGIKRLFPKDTFAAYIVFLAAFSTFSYATNGIKAGAAAAVFILALSFANKLWACIPLMILSYGMHHSMQLPVLAFVFPLLVKNPKWYYLGWSVCLLFSLFHITFFQELFAGMTDEHGADYLLSSDNDDGTAGGFRIDFILYSVMPMIVGYVALFKKEIDSYLYRILLYTYITSNAVWLLCMYASFTNRIAYLSWCIYPIVLIYPFFDEKWGEGRYKTFAKVMACHLAFTLFMNIVYYGILRN